MARQAPMWRRYLTFWGRDIDRDLHDEVIFHIDARARELIEQGWDVASAREEARRAFGDVAEIAVQVRRIDRRTERERRITLYLAEIRDDLRFAFRQFRRDPRYWGGIMLTLVVGIATSTSLFAIVDGVLLKPLPYPAPDQLVVLRTFLLPGEYVQTRQRATTMDVAAYYPAPREVTLDIGGQPARLRAAGVTSDLFDVLGVQPILGRRFSRDEMRPDGPGIQGSDFWRTFGVVIISTGVWEQYFGGSPDVIGRTLRVENVSHTIVGVMPAGFNFPARNVALWFPHRIDPADLWTGNVAAMIGRLRPDHTVGQARAELRTLMPTYLEFIPWRRYLQDYGSEADVQPFAESVVGGARRVLLVLLAAIGVVLLVLCVNVANLLLARGVARHREMVTRAALGADRWRLARQVIVESLTVSTVSGVAGVLLAASTTRALVRMLPADLPRIEEIGPDLRVVTFALVMSAAVGLVFGLLPALRATSAGRGLITRSSDPLVVDARERYVSGLLVALQFSMAVVLGSAAVLLLQSLGNLTAVNPGFRPERLVTARVAPPGFAQRDQTARYLLAERLLDELRARPAVESAALASALPFDQGLFGTVFRIEGRSGPGQASAAGATYLGVTDRYFATMGTPIIAGRDFNHEDGLTSPRVAMISERTARQHWGDQSPIGARIRFTDQRQFMIGPDGEEPFFTIVGVVGDTRFSSLTDHAPPMVYLPLSQFWDIESLRAVVRTRGTNTVRADDLQGLVSRLDRGASVSDVQTFDTRLGETIARPRFAAYLLAAFGAVAVFLAAVGAYGVLSHAMNRRSHEIGVRLALGASGREVFGLLFRHGMTLTVAGLAAGIPAAVASMRFVSALLFGVEPANPRVFAGVAAVLLLVGVCVSYVPAWRARQVDPIIALRCE
jgi:predicted permease